MSIASLSAQRIEDVLFNDSSANQCSRDLAGSRYSAKADGRSLPIYLNSHRTKDYKGWGVFQRPLNLSPLTLFKRKPPKRVRAYPSPHRAETQVQVCCPALAGCHWQCCLVGKVVSMIPTLQDYCEAHSADGVHVEFLVPGATASTQRIMVIIAKQMSFHPIPCKLERVKLISLHF